MNKPYPDASDLRHGDLLLPRPPGVPAITSPVETLMEGWRQSNVEETASDDYTPPMSGGHVDLVKYWPRLLVYLRRVAGVDPGDPKDILAMLGKVQQDLGKDFDLNDLAHAVLAKQYVGHSAIVDTAIDSQTPWVVESSHTHGGIRCIRFEEWIAERKVIGQEVWLCRLNVLANEQSVADTTQPGPKSLAFVDTAHHFRMRGMRYAIFDSAKTGAKFSLDRAEVREPGESTYLYCSELIQACAKAALKIDLTELLTPPGGHSARDVDFRMFTPKDLTRSKHVQAVTQADGGKPYIFLPPQ